MMFTDNQVFLTDIFVHVLLDVSISEYVYTFLYIVLLVCTLK